MIWAGLKTNLDLAPASTGGGGFFLNSCNSGPRISHAAQALACLKQDLGLLLGHLCRPKYIESKDQACCPGFFAGPSV